MGYPSYPCHAQLLDMTMADSQLKKVDLRCDLEDTHDGNHATSVRSLAGQSVTIVWTDDAP